MDPAARASQIRRPASPSGPLLRPISSPTAAGAGGAPMLRYLSQTSDAPTLHHDAPAFARYPTDILEKSCSPTSMPRTCQGDSGQERRVSHPYRGDSHTGRGAGWLDAIPRTGGDSHDRLAFSRNEDTLFGGNRLQGAPIQRSTVRHLGQRGVYDTACTQFIAKSSSTASTAPCSPYLEPGSGYLDNHQVRGSQLLNRQRSMTSAATSSAAQRGEVRLPSQVSSGERHPKMRQKDVAFSGLTRVSTKREALSRHLPSPSSSEYGMTPLEHLRREVHERGHFSTPQPDKTLPTPSFTLPRSPSIGTLHRGPLEPWPSVPITLSPPPRNVLSMTRQDRHLLPRDRSLLLPDPPQMATFEPPEAEGDHSFDSLDDEFTELPRGIMGSKIGCRRSHSRVSSELGSLPEKHPSGVTFGGTSRVSDLRAALSPPLSLTSSPKSRLTALGSPRCEVRGRHHFGGSQLGTTAPIQTLGERAPRGSFNISPRVPVPLPPSHRHSRPPPSPQEGSLILSRARRSFFPDPPELMSSELRESEDHHSRDDLDGQVLGVGHHGLAGGDIESPLSLLLSTPIDSLEDSLGVRPRGLTEGDTESTLSLLLNTPIDSLEDNVLGVPPRGLTGGDTESTLSLLLNTPIDSLEDDYLEIGPHGLTEDDIASLPSFFLSPLVDSIDDQLLGIGPQGQTEDDIASLLSFLSPLIDSMDDQLLEVGPRELTETDFASLLSLLLSADIDSLEDDLFETGTRGLPEAEIGCLPSYAFNTEANPEQFCAVCISQMESREIIRALPCRHKFHASCIDQWLRIKRTCPLCRWDASVAGPSAFQNN